MSLTLCVLHPDPDTRRALLGLCPAGVHVLSAATPAELTTVPPSTVLVVLLDPARTNPAHVVQACAVRPELVSISDLRVAAADVGVDAVLPLRGMTARRLSRLVFDVVQRRTMLSAS